MTHKIAVLPGDFIGPEVVDATLRVLCALEPDMSSTRQPAGFSGSVSFVQKA